MPKFFNSRDLDFIQTISEEVVNHVVEQMITLFKMSVGETKTNLYGESLGKVYHAPATLMCIVDREPQNIVHEGFGPDQTQAVQFSFNRMRLRTHEIPQIHDINGVEIPADAIQNTDYGYPEIGDIINWNGGYFEIDNTTEIQYAGGQPYNSFSIVLTAFMVSKSNLNIEERIK